MTHEELKQHAAAAIRAMSDEEKAAFMQKFEAGATEEAGEMARAAAHEGHQRFVRLAEITLENGEVMSGVVDLVGRVRLNPRGPDSKNPRPVS